jgi:hypothetical protein
MMIFATSAPAYSIIQAAAGPPEDLAALPNTDQPDRTTVKPDKIRKVRPIYKVKPQFMVMGLQPGECCLPVVRDKGWEAEAQVIFARIKGKVRLPNSNLGGTWWGLGQVPDQDLNGDWGIPDHSAVGSFSLSYRFRPKWSLRYSIMPMELNGSGGNLQNFGFGFGQGGQVKWQRLYQNLNLVYEPILTPRAKVGVFAGYTRLDEKLTFGGTTFSTFGGTPTFDHQLNMGMAGVEIERCLKTTRFRNTLSLECRAGVAFLDEAFGSDLMTGLRYTIPMGNGRWGYLGGGYRYVSFKKGYNDFKQIDTSLEGGYLKMAFIF